MSSRLMRGIKTWGLVVGSGILLGLGVVGWIKYHPSEEAASVTRSGEIPLDLSATPTPASSELQVRPANPSSAQGTLADGSNGGGGAASGGSGGTAALPGTADFKQYEQYRSSEGAMFGDIKVGDGAVVAAGSVVTVNYKGWITTGQLFDESPEGRPFTFTEGEHRVIPGWEQGLFGMKAGGKRRLIVPPAYGYGDEAHGPIPAGAVLVFDVELVSVK